MKIAISVPDAVFEQADRLADELGWSRSRLYTEAVREYIAKQELDPVTAKLNELADELNSGPVFNAGRALIDSGVWEWEE